MASLSRRSVKISHSSPTITQISARSSTTGTKSTNVDSSAKISQIAPALVDFQAVLSMVLGGCCANVWAYEQLLMLNPRIGSALTFSQMLFITAQSLPSFILFPKSGKFPKLKSRQVPLGIWGLQVLVLIAGSLLNNWAFAYNVPLTIQIVFRSAGLAVSMLFGFLFLKKRYSLMQVMSVGIVTLGVVLATLSRPSSGSNASKSTSTPEDMTRYFTGIGMLVVSLFCTATLGILQEQTYKKYGPCWKEGVFYTHLLSLPMFIFLRADIKQGIMKLSDPSSHSSAVTSYAILFANLISQLVCVSGVNRLSSQVSSVSTNIALTVRKALSLCFSVWWFGNRWNSQLALGAAMVFLGSFLYTTGGDKEKKTK
ncbi:UAA transporter [Crucibulum laeve]|uniref:UAA transporter n=1 Tax=Crucibulum laeve TaxID=68775 RepID=A0A5C3M5V6_9AGAR|nr:UAA transporter [Crucibulum laeve]